MSEEAQSARIEQLTFKYSSLREKSVIKKWEEMRRAYVTYKEKVGRNSAFGIQTYVSFRLPSCKRNTENINGYHKALITQKEAKRRKEGN